MKTVIVNIPEKEESFFLSVLQKFRFKSRVLPIEEDEGLIAKWIDEGFNSEELPAEKLYDFLRKNGVDC